jgi:anti-sigma B factor antagonist
MGWSPLPAESPSGPSIPGGVRGLPYPATHRIPSRSARDVPANLGEPPTPAGTCPAGLIGGSVTFPLYSVTVHNVFPADILNVQVTAHGEDARVVTVTGEVDALTAPELAAVLTAQLAAARLVVVDLNAVHYLASAGLRVLFEANELAIQQDRDLRLVCHSPNANRALDATGLREHFAFAGSVAHALHEQG